MNSLNELKEQWNEFRELSGSAAAPYRKYLVIGGIVLVLAIAVFAAAPALMKPKTTSPIVSISATNTKTYSPGAEIKPGDFTVKAKHRDGKTTTLSKDEYTINTTKAKGYKAATPVVITAKKSGTRTVGQATNKRKKVIEWEVGNPNSSDVKAVYYDTGELSFEGKGNCMSFDAGKMPWENSDEDVKIKAVTFGKDVAPRTIDSYFASQEELTYCDPIPDSVESMRETFSGCLALKTMPDWSKAEKLLDAESAFSGCTALKKAYPTPVNLVSIKGTFSDCEQLTRAPDMSRSEYLNSLAQAFSGCTRLVEVKLPVHARDLTETFMNCINLEAMPTIPDGTESMQSTFSGCTMLKTPSNIPASVTDITMAFSQCRKLSGEMRIDTKTEENTNAFSDAVTSLKLNLTGNSPFLNSIALSAQSGNITVNNAKPTQQQS